MYLISSKFNNHVSVKTIYDLENEIVKVFDCPKINSYFPFIKERLVKIISPFLKAVPSSKDFFAVIMDYGTIHKRLFPFMFFRSKHKGIYFFDVWENNFENVANFLRDYNVDLVFFSSKRSAEYFEKYLPNKNIYWVPEGIKFEDYKYVPYEQKHIDVLQIGRRYELYHNKIKEECSRQHVSYLYEKNKGELVFNTDDEYISGLAATKISICFPSSITHPERSGKISTITQRYYQSMASKCLVLGSAPEEMEYLFSYNPVINADLNDPVGQIQDILRNFNEYIPLIEKNFNETKNNHHWNKRAKDIKGIVMKQWETL